MLTLSSQSPTSSLPLAILIYYTKKHVCSKVGQSLSVPPYWYITLLSMSAYPSPQKKQQTAKTCVPHRTASKHHLPDWRWLIIIIFKPILHRPQAVLHQLKHHVVQVAGHVGKREVGVAIYGHIRRSTILAHAYAARIIDGILSNLQCSIMHTAAHSRRKLVG